MTADLDPADNPADNPAGPDPAGHLEVLGDHSQLCFQRRLAHSPETVWRAVTEAEHLAAWFPQRIAGEWRPGATLEFEGDGQTFEGEVLAFQPPSMLEFRWGPDVLRIEVAPAGSGCLLTLIDTFEEHGKAARDAAGWHVCVDALELHLEGARPPWTFPQRWEAVHPSYIERFGPAAATIGPPAPEA